MKPTASKSLGFTLIEVLVALSIMALMALMGWRGLDGLIRHQSSVLTHQNEAQTVQLTLEQFQSDLDHLVSIGPHNGVLFDGASLLILRQGPVEKGWPAALKVVAWSMKGGQLWRWQSDDVVQSEGISQAWEEALLWSRVEPQSSRSLALMPADDWAIYFYRDQAWTNPQSTTATTATTRADAPDAVRLKVRRPANVPLPGWFTADWISPHWTSGS